VATELAPVFFQGDRPVVVLSTFLFLLILLGSNVGIEEECGTTTTGAAYGFPSIDDG